MIIVRLMGGLGNQMFQYALGRSLAEINSCGFKLDAEEYNTYKLHEYSLGVFAIQENFANKPECDAIRFEKRSMIDRIARKILGKQRKNTQNYIKEKNFKFDPDILTLGGDKYFEGYWQTEKYFENIQGVLRSEFRLKHEMNAANLEVYKKITEVNAVSFHIRRGDYVSNPAAKAYHGVDLKKYYDNAVIMIKEKVKDPHFFIFSDEPEWVRQNFKGEFKFTVVDCNTGKNGYDDMKLMSACRHNIIANSSFSWWGAWLNQKQDKIVTAPKSWFVNSAIDTSDLIPENWIRI